MLFFFVYSYSHATLSTVNAVRISTMLLVIQSGPPSVTILGRDKNSPSRPALLWTASRLHAGRDRSPRHTVRHPRTRQGPQAEKGLGERRANLPTGHFEEAEGGQDRVATP